MKILVTGGAGFIGSNLVDALIGKGHEVLVVDNLSTGSKDNINDKAKFFEYDISNNEDIKGVIKDERPEVIFHLAAQIDVRKSVANPQWDAQQNIIGSLNILENAKNFGVKKLIFSSTGGAIYGDTNDIPTPETHVEAPISPYGIGKLTVEKYLDYYHKIFKLPYLVLRYGNVYGPRQDSKGEAGVVAIFAGLALAGQNPIIVGDGKQTRDYVYVGDIISANLKALDFDSVGIFNIGTGKETDVNALAKLINKNVEIDIEFTHGPAKLGEQKRSCLDWSKAKTELGWEPQVDLEEGIKTTIDWFKDKK